ncbi:MAG: 50S ribosomal protein L25 [Planctomycetota bacterium]
MKVVPMKAERRTAAGRNQLKSLRQQGWLPAVVYGEGRDNVAIQISEWELDQHVKQHHKVFTLDVAGSTETAFLQEVAWHPISDRPLHVDFKRIDLTKEIEAEIEIELAGHPAGLGKGGTLVKDHQLVRVRCLPTAMPESIEHDVSKLEIDDYLNAGQLQLPEGVTLVSPASMPICHVAKIVVQVAAAPAAPAEGAAAPGAEPAAGAAPADAKKPGGEPKK